MLVFKGGNFLRQRLALSTITGQPITIKEIRADDTLNPGLNDSETSLLHLLDCVTDGSKIKINDTGTTLNYTPGIIIGGGSSEKPLIHECHPSRSLSYYMEFLLMFIPFGRDSLCIKLTGTTDNSGTDHSSDLIRMVTIPLLKKIIPQIGEISLNILRRGVSQDFPGQVLLTIPVVKKIEPIIMDGAVGRIKRIRGIAWITGSASAQIATKMISKARAIMNRFIPDVWIYFDKPKKDAPQGNSEATGFGITLVAESIKGAIKGSDGSCIPSLSDVQKMLNIPIESVDDESASNPERDEDLASDADSNSSSCEDDDCPESQRGISESIQAIQNSDEFVNLTEWEKIGWLTATRLLLEIGSESIVDTSHQIYPLLFMSLSQDTATSKLKLSKLAPMTIQFMRDLKTFTNVEFTIKEDIEGGMFVTLSCTGIGFSNFARRAA
ncbi:RNA 3'-Terminal Phosphate Cyclase-like protein [Cryptosporidium canis]|uniref:RNA 3'-Terminal Phosphate Cyclase-like protein n=1 Tax=Cryptosporidium canis TaxID=195482 RepID=A0ABQ8P883_9CRYT|nr:RNA 3'-Terminal Phosphate Cyclase-like protein [Cryptosporidium canis]KAJ1614997.1 RNA 3'-Terminal Phosphate Cyclase-like protein [Cryptosporidium canis]